MQSSQVCRGASTYPGPCCTQTNNTPTRTLPLTKQRPHRRNPATPPCPDRVSTKLLSMLHAHDTLTWTPLSELKTNFRDFFSFFFLFFFPSLWVEWGGGGGRGLEGCQQHKVPQHWTKAFWSISHKVCKWYVGTLSWFSSMGSFATKAWGKDGLPLQTRGWS